MLVEVRVDVVGDERAVGGGLVVLGDVDLEDAGETHFELDRAVLVEAEVPDVLCGPDRYTLACVL